MTLPERIYGDAALLDMFGRHAKEKAIMVVTQFNHPRELTCESKRAVDALLTQGVQVRNQTVLLRGVNDRPEVLGELLRGLTAMNVGAVLHLPVPPGARRKGPFPGAAGRGSQHRGRRKGDAERAWQMAVRYAMSHRAGR